MHNMTILSYNGYYTDKTVYQNYNEEHYNLLIPNKKQESHQNDCLRRKSQRKRTTTNIMDSANTTW